MVAHAAVRARYPAFAAAVQSISSPPLRNMGTIGGNLCVDTRCTYYNQTEEWRRSIDYCMKAEGTICWVAPSSPRCWAHTATDSAPMACALGARVTLVSQDGERTIPLDDLYRDDGMEYLAKRPEEILTALHLPADATAERCRSAFWKLRRRGSIDFAVLSAAAAVWTAADGTVEKARIVLGAVASRPLAAQESADFLLGKKLDRGDDRRRRQAHPQGRDADGQHRLPDPVARHHGPALHRSRPPRGRRPRPRAAGAEARDAGIAGGGIAKDDRWISRPSSSVVSVPSKKKGSGATPSSGAVALVTYGLHRTTLDLDLMRRIVGPRRPDPLPRGSRL